MIQKVLKVGSSAAVTIPKKALKELGLKPGDLVSLSVNVARGNVLIAPARMKTGRTEKVTELALNFIERYRTDLEALADK